MERASGVERAQQYAESVVSGETPACSYVKRACQRHLDDIRKDDFPYRFDEECAERAIRFCENLVLFEGKVFAGEAAEMAPWQCFVLANIFGWVDSFGDRRYQTVYIEIPRKNGKSTLAALIGLYMVLADGEPGAQVYACAKDKLQARIVFDAAQAIFENTTGLAESFGAETRGTKNTVEANIYVPGTRSIFKPLPGEKKGNLEGKSTHCAILDELHVQADRALFESINQSIEGRTQPLVLCITTAGDDIGGICYEQRSYLIDVLEGRVADDEYFGLVYTIDEGDDWRDESSWFKANPMLGYSKNPRGVRNKFKRALERPAAQADFKTKQLNVWVTSSSPWMNMEKYKKIIKPIDLKKLKGKMCWLSIDLSKRTDLTAWTAIFKRKGKFHSYTKYYIPQATLDESTNKQYRGWVDEGKITVLPGEKIEQEFIEKDIAAFGKDHRIVITGTDPYQGAYLGQRLESKHGIPHAEFQQTQRYYNRPMRELEALIYSKEFYIDDNPVTEWCFSNCVVNPNSKEEIMPSKQEKRVNLKIDSVQTHCMSLQFATDVEPEEEGFIDFL